MRFYIDLGFPGAALLLVLLVGPVVAFVARQKWLLAAAAARQAEVRRLALLAAQEAEMAEMEAMASYSATSADGAYSYSTYVAKELATRPECAVCSTLATARCSRCKTVIYWYVERGTPFSLLSLMEFCNFIHFKVFVPCSSL